jgi:hypothetical protein
VSARRLVPSAPEPDKTLTVADLIEGLRQCPSAAEVVLYVNDMESDDLTSVTVISDTCVELR